MPNIDWIGDDVWHSHNTNAEPSNQPASALSSLAVVHSFVRLLDMCCCYTFSITPVFHFALHCGTPSAAYESSVYYFTLYLVVAAAAVGAVAEGAFARVSVRHESLRSDVCVCVWGVSFLIRHASAFTHFIQCIAHPIHWAICWQAAMLSDI